MPGRTALFRREDLAPGDRVVAEKAWAGLRLHIIASADDPLFASAYGLLHDEFAARGELETPAILAARLAWRPDQPRNGCALLYRLLLLLDGDTPVAVRDHTAILPAGAPEVVVHLSHVLVVPTWRGRGLAALLRTLPVDTARACAAAAGRPGLGATLVAEMEKPDPAKPDTMTRLHSYGRAGFLKVDPHIGYCQPDFRPFAAIDASGGPRPLPMDLVVRRIGRETEYTIPAGELQVLVRALYTMYAAAFRPQDMQPCLDWATRLEQSSATGYTLLHPTA